MPHRRPHFLITAGGTREYIDPVRFITNASSGRTGYALAEAALRSGCRVTLITAPAALKAPAAAKVVKVQTAQQMFRAVKRHFPGCDCLIMAAAVADYSPIHTAKTKTKKTIRPITIKLKPTPDILKWAAAHKNKGCLVVGFALEDTNLRRNAQKKLTEKNLDMIIANSPAVIGRERTTVHIKMAHSPWLRLADADKTDVAAEIIRLIRRLLAKNHCQANRRPLHCRK
jgi:phosphopantothenoylcysteine decarboxylase/phosphopantothenate--cysteine ligase